MLELNSRRMLLESFAPPQGFRLDWTVGTTYTLDLTALLAAPVAFAFADYQDREGAPLCDPLALLKAVRKYADRMLLFCQAGRIHVPKKYQPLMSSLEGSIMEAAILGGSFHPKVWFLRYENDEKDVKYRFLCLSRNMTFDRSWDTMLCLEGDLTARSNAYSRNKPLKQFVEALPGMCQRKLSKIWKARIETLADELQRVDFKPPSDFAEDGITFHPIGIDSSNHWPFPGNAKRMLVVSPYVSENLLKRLAGIGDSVQLISRVDQLELLEPGTLKQFATVSVLDDAAEPEASDAEPTSAVDSTQDSNADVTAHPDLDARPFTGLHAKAYIVDHGWDSSIFTGSANATHAAFHLNVEFLTELRGKRSFCGVDAVLGSTSNIDEPKKRSAGRLADLLKPFRVADDAVEVDKIVKDFEEFVDKVSQSIGSSRLEANCEPTKEKGIFAISLRPMKKWIRPDGQDFELRVRLASLGAFTQQQVAFDQPIWAEFKAVSMLSLTSFFVFEVSSVSSKLTRQFLLNIALQDEPDDRKEALLRSLLSDPDRVLRFMLLLLSDADADDFASLFDAVSNESGTNVFSSALTGGSLFESLLRSLDRRPECLKQVAEMIDDLNKSDDGRQLLPKDLDSIWQPIWEVAERKLAKGEKGGQR